MMTADVGMRGRGCRKVCPASSYEMSSLPRLCCMRGSRQPDQLSHSTIDSIFFPWSANPELEIEGVIAFSSDGSHRISEVASHRLVKFSGDASAKA